MGSGVLFCVGAFQVLGDIALGPGDEIPGAEFPLAVLFHEGVQLPVHPDDQGKNWPVTPWTTTV